MQLAAANVGDVTRASCTLLEAGDTSALAEACAMANPVSLQYSMLVTVSLYVLSGVLLIMAAKPLKKELQAN